MDGKQSLSKEDYHYWVSHLLSPSFDLVLNESIFYISSIYPQRLDKQRVATAHHLRDSLIESPPSNCWSLQRARCPVLMDLLSSCSLIHVCTVQAVFGFVLPYLISLVGRVYICNVDFRDRRPAPHCGERGGSPPHLVP